MEGLLNAGIFTRAAEDLHLFCANINAVPKKSFENDDFSKTQLHLNKIQNIHPAKTRLAIDLRELKLPTITDVKNLIPDNAITSQLDVRQMFFSIKIKPDSKKYLNFWWHGVQYTHNRLPMGCKISSWVGQRVSEATFSDINLKEFLKLNKLQSKSREFPYAKVSEFLISYVDDILLLTNGNLPNANEVHLKVLEFALFCTERMGLKMARNKVEVFKKSFIFMGHSFENKQ